MTADLIDRLRHVVGPSAVISDPDEMAGYLTDWRNAYAGTAAAVVRPGDTEEVAAVVALCAEAGVAVVPQGGNTGLCGGAVPDSSGRQVVLSLSRMRRIRDLDIANQTITVEAGAVLQSVQEAAAAAGRLFPLSLGAEGSCTIGGNLATNAGGTTLGVITAAVLKLFPAVRSRATAWVALPGPQAAVDLIGVLRELAGDRLTGFEIMSQQSVGFVLRHSSGARDPLGDRHPWYALVELSDTLPGAGLDGVIESALGEAFERDLVVDAVVASGSAQAAALWALREGISEAQNHEGPSLKHDVTVPVSRIPAFVERTDRALEEAIPGIRIVTYGHIGDGNLHYNLSKPVGSDDDEFRARAADLARVIYDSTGAFDGSISAEHGLGQSKRGVIADYKDHHELELMRGLKQLFDPRGLMNPGKVLPG
ncbi:FAD/FMN-containing dehydrogenase [Micromonospora purpureochromogenes]|uniref:FAD/FMN-containing dehydrogenase n=1 Tax=Micromonospora purpureochromogenes TaxID=47872 RepID=A0A1C5A164_9ACTN|nr:FAD-binding oxidoreductase [Micromonospora purpureochromogenes]SCF38992.1 FAD/FMN-containing dehydrogenase [Micromonospora purpureochromogenes]